MYDNVIQSCWYHGRETASVDFGQGIIERVNGQFFVAEIFDPLDGFHQGFVAKSGEVVGINFLQPEFSVPATSGLANPAADKVSLRSWRHPAC